ncbi:hypothetical protein [Nitrosomonas communis]|uniref:hypothetical protein n=1 Tax=Nitrosomonas communis TaxID=44574 RepID=UPI001115220E|nr:hypothetical protein [Nitrosomonas communis]
MPWYYDNTAKVEHDVEFVFDVGMIEANNSIRATCVFDGEPELIPDLVLANEPIIYGLFAVGPSDHLYEQLVL